MRTGDARAMCGHDIRRVGMWPEDAERAQMLAQRYNGTVTSYPVGLAAVCFEFQTSTGQTITVTAATASQALVLLAQRMET